MNTKYRLLLILCFALFSGKVLAQQEMVLYHMHDVPQSNRLNPAIAISRGWIVSIPALGDMAFQASLPISYNNLGAGENNFPADKLLSKLRSNNIISFNTNISLFNIGYRSKKSYYQFSINERVNANLAVSKDLFNILLKGNGEFVGRTLESSVAMNGIHYREYAFNFAHEVRPKFWLGARAKLLFGRMGISSPNNSVQFYTHPETYALTLRSDLLIKASFPATVSLDDSKRVDNVDIDFKAKDFTFNTQNMGLGLDLGLSKEFESGLNVSASLLNLGYVNWKKNTHSFKQDEILYFNNPLSAINEWDALVDTLDNFTQFAYDSTITFRQSLAPVFMGGVSYPINNFLRAGFTGNIELHSQGCPWAASVNMYTQNLPIIDVGLAYTVTRYSYANVGVGLAARLGSFNLHLLTDNVIALMRPFHSRFASFQFGMSFRICRKDKSDKFQAPFYSDPDYHFNPEQKDNVK